MVLNWINYLHSEYEAVHCTVDSNCFYLKVYSTLYSLIWVVKKKSLIRLATSIVWALALPREERYGVGREVLRLPLPPRPGATQPTSSRNILWRDKQIEWQAVHWNLRDQQQFHLLKVDLFAELVTSTSASPSTVATCQDRKHSYSCTCGYTNSRN